MPRNDRVIPIQARPPRASKRRRIVELFRDEKQDIVRIAARVGARPSYVAHVLQEEGLIHEYFDLYSHVADMRNIYAPAFRGVLSFKSPEAARRSVERIDALYRAFEDNKDRAGQHHAMIVALTGLNRARWCGKAVEAEVFREWLEARLWQPEPLRRSA